MQAAYANRLGRTPSTDITWLDREHCIAMLREQTIPLHVDLTPTERRYLTTDRCVQ